MMTRWQATRAVTAVGDEAVAAASTVALVESPASSRHTTRTTSGRFRASGCRLPEFQVGQLSKKYSRRSLLFGKPCSYKFNAMGSVELVHPNTIDHVTVFNPSFIITIIISTQLFSSKLNTNNLIYITLSIHIYFHTYYMFRAARRQINNRSVLPFLSSTSSFNFCLLS